MYSDLPADALGSNDDADNSAASIAIPVAIAWRPTAPVSFKSEMARVMQVVADEERARLDTLVGDEEIAQVEKIHVRAAAEAAQLGKHADEDVGLVNAWYDSQVKQLREAADHQIEDRRRGLAESLSHHGSLIGAEVQSVHSAVEGYRATLVSFFGRLAEEQDPGMIARLAGTLPDLPDLDLVTADARARSMRESDPGPATDAIPSVGADSAGGLGESEPEREPVPVMDSALMQRVSILSGLGMPVARPGPSAVLGDRSGGSSTEWDSEESADAVLADASVSVPPNQASTIWTTTSDDSLGQ
jgi:hypothetical protein